MAKKFIEGASKWRLTLNIEKMKGMAVGERLVDKDVASVQVEGGEIEMVEHFAYLGSVLSSIGDVVEDMKHRIAKPSRVFGCLRGPIFNNPFLSLPTKRMVYGAAVLAMLLYGAEM